MKAPKFISKRKFGEVSHVGNPSQFEVASYDVYAAFSFTDERGIESMYITLDKKELATLIDYLTTIAQGIECKPNETTAQAIAELEAGDGERLETIGDLFDGR